MLSIVNSVRLIGNLGKDPEVTYLDNGNAKAIFSIATNEVYFDKDGKRQSHSEWHNITVWGKKAEYVEKYCRKGTSILAEGKLRTETWKDKEGKSHYRTFVLAEEIMILGQSSAKDGE